MDELSWSKFASQIEEDIKNAKLNQYKITEKNVVTTKKEETNKSNNSSGFKKIKIVEEDDEPVKEPQKVEEKITPHLRN
jgi:hypothetical protein